MIAEKFKITPAEAERTHETFVGTFNKGGRLPPKVARGYVDLLRQERPVPTDVDHKSSRLFPAAGSEVKQVDGIRNPSPEANTVRSAPLKVV